MKNVFVKKLLILYFIAVLFFIKTNNLSYTCNSLLNENNTTIVNNLISNRNCKNCFYFHKNDPILAVGFVTGEVAAGFTLAEVLITLLIIGIVASLVIPALIQDTQEAELHTAWKKTYSDLDQAARRIMIDNGGNLNGLDDSKNLRDKYSDYLSFIKKCDAGKSFNNCWHNNSNTTKFLNGEYYNGWSDVPGLVIANGVLLQFWYLNSNCQFMFSGKIPVCGWIDIDINGFKGPNTVGKDIYSIYVEEHGIKPVGNGNNCTSSNNGYDCIAKYLVQ